MTRTNLIVLVLLGFALVASAHGQTKMQYPATFVCKPAKGVEDVEERSGMWTITAETGEHAIECRMPWDRDRPVKVVKARILNGSLTHLVACTLQVHDVVENSDIHLALETVGYSDAWQVIKFTLPEITPAPTHQYILTCEMPADGSRSGGFASSIESVIVNN